MPLDFAHAHAPRIKRENLIIKTLPVGLVLFHQLRPKAAIPVTGNGHGHFAGFSFEGFSACLIAGIPRGVAYPAMLFMTKAVRHFRIQSPFHDLPGQLLQDAVLPSKSSGFS